MLVKTYGSAVQGVDATTITVEVNISRGANFYLVGLPDAAVKESQQRIDSALREHGYKIPIKKAEVGNVLKEDVIEADLVKDKIRKVIFAFNVKILPEANELAKKMDIKIFENNIIYRIFEEYEEWVRKRKEKEALEMLSKISRPVRLKILRNCIFRSSKPCIVGIEVLAGKLVPGVKLGKNRKFVGKVKEIQKEGETIYEANVGEKAAISMEEPIAGRHFKEEDILESILSSQEIEILKKFKEKLSENERKLLEELSS